MILREKIQKIQKNSKKAHKIKTKLFKTKIVTTKTVKTKL